MATPLENEDVQKINEEALSNFLENAAQVLHCERYWIKISK